MINEKSINFNLGNCTYDTAGYFDPDHPIIQELKKIVMDRFIEDYRFDHSKIVNPHVTGLSLPQAHPKNQRYLEGVVNYGNGNHIKYYIPFNYDFVIDIKKQERENAKN